MSSDDYCGIAREFAKVPGVKTVVVAEQEGLLVCEEGDSGGRGEAIAAIATSILHVMNREAGELAGRVSYSIVGGDYVLVATSLNGPVIAFLVDRRAFNALVTAIPRIGERVPCPKCGLDLARTVTSCPKCGSPMPFLAHQCPSCGEIIATKKCPRCGALVDVAGRLRKKRFGIF